MIHRVCKRDDCTTPFEVKYPSDPKEYCGRRCVALAVAGPKTMSLAEAGRKGVQKRLEERQRGANRILAYLDGLSALEMFESGVRLGYERRQRELTQRPLGDIGKLTESALRS